MISISGNALNDWNDNGIENNQYPLFIISSGYQKFVTKNLKINRPAGRVDFQLIYLIKGRGYYNFGDGPKEVGKGNLIVYKPGQPQLYEYFFRDETELYWLHFSGSQAHEWIKRLKFNARYVYPIGIRGDCIDLFKKITYEIQNKRTYFEYVSSAYLQELFLIFARRLENLESDGRNLMSDAMRAVIMYMYENYNKNITVSTLASQCNLSMFRFIHKFKEATGMTPIEYLTKIRIDEARYLLSNSNLNISEIASIVGYDDPLYFSRVFKKVTGVSPRYYKV